MKPKQKIKALLKNIYAHIFLQNAFRSESLYEGNEKQGKADEYSDALFNSPYEPPENQAEYEKEEQFKIPSTSLKPVAFYLPQFHPFKENDQFWGKGFTEWNNVSRALPLFKGHYQPRLPGELGFYDLRLKEVMQQQIELAKQSGIFGFCFHHYYLRNKPVMRKPFDMFLADKKLDFPFCLHWANEPWTARWDGGLDKGDILLNQKHDEEENKGFINDTLEAFRDKRYIRIDGKPVLLIYRPALFPDFKKTAEMWRSFCKENGLGGLYLVMVQTFFDNTKDPEKYACDAAVEFPPHQGFCVPKKLGTSLRIDDFDGEIIDYKKLAAFSMQKGKPDYTLFRGVMPGWDNTARTREAKIYHGSSPAAYQEWLNKIGRYTLKNLPDDRQFIFINAWNEWAEAAYLEPDRKYGYAFLNATARAILASGKPD